MLWALALLFVLNVGAVFIAVGRGPNSIVTSPDGLTWTGRGVGVISEAQAVCYSTGQSRWLVGGPGATFKLAQSTSSGALWTGVTTPFALSFMSACVWSPELRLFAVVGHGGSMVSSSRDLVAWSTTGSTVLSGFGSGVAWGDGKFVAVGGPCDTGCVQNSIAHSFDGVTWIGQGMTMFRIGRGVTWSPVARAFVAVGATPTASLVARSRDGIVWEPAGNVFGNGDGRSATFMSDRWVVGGSCCSTMWSSVDGLTNWQAVDPMRLVSDFYTWGLAFSPELGRLVAASEKVTALATTSDVTVGSSGWTVLDQGRLLTAGLGVAWGREDACGDLANCSCGSGSNCRASTSVTLLPGSAIGVGNSSALAISGTLTLVPQSGIVVNAVNPPSGTLISATGAVTVSGSLTIFVSASSTVQLISGASVSGGFSASAIQAFSVDPCQEITSVTPSSTSSSLSVAITTVPIAGCVPPTQQPAAGQSSGSNLPLIVGVVVGGVLGLAVIAAITGALIHRAVRQKERHRVRLLLEADPTTPYQKF